MAILTEIETNTGEVKELYLRVNNIDVSNHGVKALALIRGFISEDAFKGGKCYAHEEEIEVSVDVKTPVWDQVYAKLKEAYPRHKDC